MENESIREKNLRMMREALDAKNYVHKKVDQFKSNQTKNAKNGRGRAKAIKDQKFIAKTIKDSEDPEDFEKKLKP
jgi:hypothetical protein